MGLPLAVATYFLSNRLLPVAADNRAELEIAWFFFGWLLMVCYPLLRGAKKPGETAHCLMPLPT